MRAMSISSDPRPPMSLFPNLMSDSSCPVAAASPNGDPPPPSTKSLIGAISSSLSGDGDEDVWAGVGDGVEVMVGIKAATSSLSGGTGDVLGGLLEATLCWTDDCMGVAPRGEGIEISAMETSIGG